MRIDIMTLFPDAVEAMMGSSIIGRARERGFVTIQTHQIRDYTTNKQMQVDDYPYGGGRGAVMQADPLYRCWQHICDEAGQRVHTIYMSPCGRTFDQQVARELKEQYDFIFMDCVPYSSLADAHIVARLADVTLYVMRAGCVKKRDLAGLQKIWKNGELKRMGIVLCDVEPHGRSSRGYAVYRSLDTSSPCAEK